MKTIHAAVAFIVLALGSPAHASQGWSFDADAGAGYDSNAGNAAATSDDRRTTRTADAGLGANYTVPFSLFTALQFRGSLSGQASSPLEKLSNALATARVRLLHKPGEGFYVPVLAAWTSAAVRESASRLRSGGEYRVGTYVTEPVTTKIQLRLGGSWMHRDATSRVFDGNVRSYEANLDWAALPSLTLYGGYRLDHGAIVVSAQGFGVVAPKTEHKVLVNAADRIEQDDAFGSDWWAFRVFGRTGIATLGANVPLSQDVSLDVQVREAHATVPYDNAAYYGSGGPGPSGSAVVYPSPTYDRWLAGVSLLFRF